MQYPQVIRRSALVGMAVMVVLLPVPGYVASFIHGLQEQKMTKVRITLCDVSNGQS